MKISDCLLLISLISAPAMTSWADPSNIRPSVLLESAQQPQDHSVRTRGVIRRADLKTVVQNGMPRLLAQARLVPHKVGGRFVGFQLKRIKSGSMIERAGFRSGDVIISVNQEAIGRPEQMMHTLSLLPYAQTLSVQFERGGIQRVWTWLIN